MTSLCWTELTVVFTIRWVLQFIVRCEQRAKQHFHPIRSYRELLTLISRHRANPGAASNVEFLSRPVTMSRVAFSSTSMEEAMSSEPQPGECSAGSQTTARGAKMLTIEG